MLILVAVTVSVALNGGIFNNANEAKTKTQRQSEKEELISVMVGAYDGNGNFATSTVGDLPNGARWCEEADENWANVNPDNQPTNWIITKNNNKFYIDESGSVLDEKPETIEETNAWYDLGLTSQNVKYGVTYTRVTGDTGGADLTFYEDGTLASSSLNGGSPVSKSYMEDTFGSVIIGTNYFLLNISAYGVAQLTVFDSTSGATFYQNTYTGEFDLDTFIQSTPSDCISTYTVSQ